MSVNQNNQIKRNIFENESFLTKSVNFVQGNPDKDISNKRYSNSSNKNISHSKEEKSEEIEKLNHIYISKEKEYNILLNQYKEILDTLNQKKDFLNKNKTKYQSLITNNNNMKIILLKLMKTKGE